MFLKALLILFCVLISILVLAEDKVSVNQLDQAIASFRKEVDDNPKDAEAHYYLGSAYFSQGRLKQAVIAYQKAVFLQHEYAKAYNNLGYVYLGFESPWFDSDLGIEYYKKAARLGYKGDQIWLEKNGYDW